MGQHVTELGGWHGRNYEPKASSRSANAARTGPASGSCVKTKNRETQRFPEELAGAVTAEGDGRERRRFGRRTPPDRRPLDETGACIRAANIIPLQNIDRADATFVAIVVALAALAIFAFYGLLPVLM